MHVAWHGDKFDCRHCRFGRHCDDDFHYPGSRGPAPFDAFTIAGIGDSRTCWLPMITDLSRELLRQHAHYKQHFLPLAGGLQDQPAAWIEAMEIIESTQHRIERERMEKQPRGRR